MLLSFVIHNMILCSSAFIIHHSQYDLMIFCFHPSSFTEWSSAFRHSSFTVWSYDLLLSSFIIQRMIFYFHHSSFTGCSSAFVIHRSQYVLKSIKLCMIVGLNWKRINSKKCLIFKIEQYISNRAANDCSVFFIERQIQPKNLWFHGIPLIVECKLYLLRENSNI